MANAINKLWAMGLLAILPAVAGASSKVPVCLGSWAYAPPYVLSRAKFLSSQMLATAGVDLEWRAAGSSACRKGDPRTVMLEFSIDTPADYRPDALAYTQPYEGVHVVILFDRVEQCTASPNHLAAILAHVIAHELTHLIEGVSRHSATGVMKARWSAREMQEMANRPMEFAEEDVDLIQSGLQRRMSSAVQEFVQAGAIFRMSK